MGRTAGEEVQLAGCAPCLGLICCLAGSRSSSSSNSRCGGGSLVGGTAGEEVQLAGCCPLPGETRNFCTLFQPSLARR